MFKYKAAIFVMLITVMISTLTGCHVSDEEKAEITQSVKDGLMEFYGVPFDVYGVDYSGGTDFNIVCTVKMEDDESNFSYRYSNYPDCDLEYAYYAAEKAYSLLDNSIKGFPDNTHTNLSITALPNVILNNKDIRNKIINNNISADDLINASKNESLTMYRDGKPSYGYEYRFNITVTLNERPAASTIINCYKSFADFLNGHDMDKSETYLSINMKTENNTTLTILVKIQENGMLNISYGARAYYDFSFIPYEEEFDNIDSAADEIIAAYQDLEYFQKTSVYRRQEEHDSIMSSVHADNAASREESSDNDSGSDNESSSEISDASDEIQFYSITFANNDEASKAESVLKDNDLNVTRILNEVRFITTDDELQRIIEILDGLNMDYTLQ